MRRYPDHGSIKENNGINYLCFSHDDTISFINRPIKIDGDDNNLINNIIVSESQSIKGKWIIESPNSTMFYQSWQVFFDGKVDADMVLKHIKNGKY